MADLKARRALEKKLKRAYRQATKGRDRPQAMIVNGVLYVASKKRKNIRKELNNE